MNNTSIFELDAEGQLVINKPEIRKIKEYADILKRDKGSPADWDGKKKLKSFAELLYIYLILDPRSMFYVLPLSERRIKAKELVGLPDLREDDVIKAAIIRYEADMRLNSSANSYLAAERFLYSTSEDIHKNIELIQELKKQSDELSSKLLPENGDKSTLGDMEKITFSKELAGVISQIVDIETKIEKIISKLPNMTTITRELAIKYAEEGGSFKAVVGGGTLGNREE